MKLNMLMIVVHILSKRGKNSKRLPSKTKRVLALRNNEASILKGLSNVVFVYNSVI